MVKRRPLSANRPPPQDNRNLLLAALPADEYKRVAQSLDTVPLKLKSLIHRAGDPVEHVYFPGGGFCSLVTVLKDGGMVEVATIGREGMVGVNRCTGRQSGVVNIHGARRNGYPLPDEG